MWSPRSSTPLSLTLTVRRGFIDYSSAFDPIVPTRLADKLIGLGLKCVPGSSSLILNIGSPQGCILSPPLLYSLYTHDFVSRSSDNSIVKVTDDIVMVGLISSNNETAHLD